MEKHNLVVCEHEPESMKELLIWSKKLLPIFKDLSKLCGDYFVGEWVLERKAASDFVSSVADGRLFNTALEFKKIMAKEDVKVKCGFIIEGSFYQAIKKHRITQEQINGCINKLIMDYHCACFITATKKQTVGLLEKLVEHYQTPYEPDYVRAKMSRATLSEQQEWVLMGLPGIGSITAKKYLAEKKTLLAAIADMIVFPSDSQIMTGVLRKKILQLLNHQYGSEKNG